jgi:uncharacterized protein YjbJ (UPF0337 family)
MEPMEKDSRRRAGLEGIVEDVKGKVREVIGRVTGRGDVEAEDEAKPEQCLHQERQG